MEWAQGEWPFQVQSVNKPICALLRPESPSTHQGIINKDFLDGMKPNPRTLSLGVSFWFFSPTYSYSNNQSLFLLRAYPSFSPSQPLYSYLSMLSLAKFFLKKKIVLYLFLESFFLS
jgi:hypothetical protein